MKLRVVDNEEVMEKIEAVKNFNCMKGKKMHERKYPLHWEQILYQCHSNFISVLREKPRSCYN